MASALDEGWEKLDCRLTGIRELFDECAPSAIARMGEATLAAYWGMGRTLGKLGRGPEPVRAWLIHWPEVVEVVGESLTLPLQEAVTSLVQRMQKSPNSAAIAPLLHAIGPVARALGGIAPMKRFLQALGHMMDQTTGSIHGRQASLPSPGLHDLLQQTPRVLQRVSLNGWCTWIDFGARVHRHHPSQQIDYFALRSPDSLAVLQQQLHGVLLRDVDRQLGLTLWAMWAQHIDRVPLPTWQEEGQHLPRVRPCLQASVMGLPDVLDHHQTCSGLQRYRLMVMHMAGHARWSSACVADNWSPAQRMAVEWFEDTRVDWRLIRQWPGLRTPMLALYPKVKEDGCDDKVQACLLHRLSVLGRAVLDSGFHLRDTTLRQWTQRLHALCCADATDTAQVAQLALQFVAQTRRPSDSFADVNFEGVDVDWRDDNRHLWVFIEEGDEEDTSATRAPLQASEIDRLPPQLYPEWDYLAKCDRPDWVRVFESLHPSGDAALIDDMLQRHAQLSKRLQSVLDQLKPQGRMRQRHLENGSELDLDLALAASIDLRCGQTPSDRVEQHTHPTERNISVQLVMDLSASQQDTLPGGHQTVLQISQEAVALLAWALARLGDPLAIGGFHSNTRHEVRYMHIKGFDEAWDDVPKSRLAALKPAWSTRMGAALRHAGRTLVQRPSDKKLMLVLTDGEPSDVDVSDPRWLIEDAHKAVQALEAQGIVVWCIHLNAQHDGLVRAIYGHRYMVVSPIERLPERLADLFVTLTA